MCPNNRLGTVDLFIVSHHGQAISNSPVLVHALAPARGDHEQRHAQGRPAGRDEGAVLVAGARRPLADALLAAERPGIHRARDVHRQRRRRAAGGDADRRNRCPRARTGTPPPPAHNGAAYWIKVSARDDGSFTVTNARNGFSKDVRGETQVDFTC